MTADAAGFYKCVDSSGNVTFADDPVPGAKCESRRGDNDIVPSERQLPPTAGFTAQTELAAIPGTKVYVVPESGMDVFFHNSWWWCLWEGRWYYSRHYNSGWVHYKRVPSFYAKIPAGWRNDYAKNGKHWERQQIGGMQGLNPQIERPGVQQKDQKPKQRDKVKPKRQTKPQKREAVKQEGQTGSQQREAPQRSKP